MEDRPRCLLVGLPPASVAAPLAAAHYDLVPATAGDVAAHLRNGHRFAAVVADPAVVTALLDQIGRDDLILGHIDQGLAVLDAAGIVVWANPLFGGFCGGDPIGQTLLDALGGPTVAAVRVGETAPPAGGPSADPPPDPVAAAATGRPVVARLFRPRRPDQPYLEVALRPVRDAADGAVFRLLALARDMSPEIIQRQKLDALHAAGREMAGLDADQLSEMNVPTRVELLKLNLRRYIRDLLHYDTIEVRLLDRKTGALRPLLEDGMTPEAAGRTLHARPTGNGVTGFVAYTGQSYLCPDTAQDPHYIIGAAGARSSLTVPLLFHDEVIGTLNVESPRPDAFGPDDLQFTELFSREVATALHTLDLLSAQQVCTAAQSIDAVNREIALPIDDVLASASVLLGRIGDPASADADHLRRILRNARQVKDSVAQVGRDTVAAGPLGVGDGVAPLSGRRVLVVDPDERTRRQAHLLIGRLGARVEAAATGADGLALAVDNAYDAIFLDVKPPDMGGYEAYRRFRAARPAAVLALTTGFGYDVAHSIVKARQDGMRHVLFKPFKPDQVVSAVLDTAPPGSAAMPAPLPRPAVAGTPAV